MKKQRPPLDITTLDLYTAQEVFDYSAKHLLTQAAGAVDDRGKCRYRVNGKTCAIGCFIPETSYMPCLERLGIFDLLKNFRQSKKHYDILFALRDTHDHRNENMWQSALNEVSIKFNLTFHYAQQNG